MNKRFSGLLFLLTLSNNLFSESYGFAANHSGFWSYAGGIVLWILAIVITIVLFLLVSDEMLGLISDQKEWVCVFPIVFSIIAFWIFPTYLCSFLGVILGLAFSFFFINSKNRFSVWCGIICSFVFIFSIMLAAKMLPQEWWGWKYFFIALIFIFVAQYISYIYYSSRSLAIFFLSSISILVLATTVNEFSLHIPYISKFAILLALLLIILLFPIGIKCLKKYGKMQEEKFGRSLKEINYIIKNASKSGKHDYELRNMVKYLKRAVAAFELNDESEAIDNLESYFKYYDRFDEDDVKGPTNKKNFKEFCTLADLLAKKLEYKHKKHSYYNSILNDINDDDDDSTCEDDYELDTEQSNDEGDPDKDKNRARVYKNAIKDLNNMIGMDSVKQQIQELANHIKMNNKRKEFGLKSTSQALHIVFTGNPGTGKTSVAKILARLFYGVGLLPTDKCVEVDRSKLVEEHIGGTAVRVQEVCDKAMGGVLFIDEAYSLAHEDDPRDFGHEAIDTLLKRMEDDRGKFVVIVAGYKEEMQCFINSNPGLKRRFNRYIELPDYSVDELCQIAEVFAKEDGNIFSNEAKVAVRKKIEGIVAKKDKNFGNAGTIRDDVYGLAVARMDNRLATLEEKGKKITKKALCTILPEDIV